MREAFSMAEVVSKFINENKEQLHQELLKELNIFEDSKEFAPEEYTKDQAEAFDYIWSETVDGKKRYYKITKTTPEITDEEYSQLLAIAKHRRGQSPQASEPVSYKTKALQASGECFGAKFLKAMAAILWIGGLILAIVVSNETVTRIEEGYYSSRAVTEKQFNWQTFFSTLILYFTAGAFSYCMSELMKNVQIIASSVTGYTTEKEKLTPKKK